MSALPYIPLFVADYLADTSHLSTIEHGAYLLLIMNYWQRGGPLPSGDVGLSRIAKLTPRQWRKVRPSISPFFTEVNGEWVHKKNLYRPDRRRIPGNWEVLRRTVFERDDYTCSYCGERTDRPEADHFYPVVRGGTDDIDNLVTSCMSCNRSKGHKTFEEWQAWLN